MTAQTKTTTNLKPEGEPQANTPEPAKEKPKASKKINMTEVFDLVDEMWQYLLSNESRTRLCGRAPHDDIKDINLKVNEMRVLIHGEPEHRRTDQGRTS